MKTLKEIIGQRQSFVDPALKIGKRLGFIVLASAYLYGALTYCQTLDREEKARKVALEERQNTNATYQVIPTHYSSVSNLTARAK